MDKNIIFKTISWIIDCKCKPTVSEMRGYINGLSDKEKITLLKYAGANIKEYENLKNKGASEEELFKIEREIFEGDLNKKQRDNVLQYLVDFNEEDYSNGNEGIGEYPSFGYGAVERRQNIVQEERGYTPEIMEGITNWTNGLFSEINEYVHHKGIGRLIVPNHKFIDKVKSSANAIMDYINNSEGLVEDTIIYRGGHWDIGMSVGDVGILPCLNSASYSKDVAYEIGIDERGKKDPYMIKIYAPSGTKGINVNAPSLAETYPEHEYLLGKGQKYIVLDVDDGGHTASILLLN